MLPAYIPTKKSTISSIVIAVGLAITFLNAITPNPMNMVMVVAITLLAYVIESTGKTPLPKSLLRKAVKFIAVMWFCGVLCSVVWWKSDILCLGDLELLLYGVFASLIISYRNLRLLPLQIVFYLISAYLINRCVLQNAALDEIFFYSTNGYMISVLLAIATMIQLLEWREKKTISILPPIIIFFLSFYSWSRTGLICALLYLLVVFFFIIEGKVRIGKTGIYFIFTLLMVAVGYYLWNKFSVILSDNDLMLKFEEHGVNTTGRSGIWKEYLSQLNIISIIFGGNVEAGAISKEFGGDVHNSYVQLHATIGLIALWVIYYLIKCGKILFMKDRFIFWLFIVMIVRGFFDSLFFWNVYDFAIFIFVIYAFQTQTDVDILQKNTDVQLSII